jgi:hypothetical protein
MSAQKLTLGQLLYETCASLDRSSRLWSEWREVPDDEKTRIEEELVPQLRAWVQEKQEDEDED